MRLKVDNRIRVVLENAAATHHRALVVLIGEKSKDQVVFIHNLLSNTCLQQASVLWCYKSELSLSSNKKKRFRQIQAAIKTGQFDPNEDNLFEKFVSTTSIKYCYYKDTFRILGNTFKMCVLQDFEGVTANTLCRVVETVEGGGAVVLLLQSLNSLCQLYTLSMDVHARYRTHARQNIVPRFNERLLQSLATCSTCIIIDDQLRVVPHSIHVAEIVPLHHMLAKSTENKRLVALKKELKDTPPLGKIIELCRTLDQAKVLLEFSLCITEKLLRTTVSLTAARGRGKSAAMGLAIACAISFGYSNIFVTSPSPENLKTLFEFLVKGLLSLGYEEILHFTVERSSDPSLQKSVVRVTVNRDRRQFVQYISPQEHQALGQAELLAIDEAAAIPLPLVQKLLGPYLVFLSSTVSGYEGTGRSLTLKLIAELRAETQEADASHPKKDGSKRKLVELTLEESIRYKPGDPVEAWLSSLLCLEPCLPALPEPLPPAHLCQLYYVNRDTLFSYHAMSEQFLSFVQSLLVASHYRNSPDDLQQLSDAPAHRLFVLLPPPPHPQDTLPTVLVVLQVVLEGGISRSATIKGLSCSDGERPAGDLIPWTISNAFQNYDFPQFSGARILRISTHPSVQGKGYGSRAVELLLKYYSSNRHLADCKKIDERTLLCEDSMKILTDSELAKMSGTSQKVDTANSAKAIPPLLVPLMERPAEPMHYVGVAYGVTHQLLTFWKRAGFTLVYFSEVRNSLTGEHTVIMLQQLEPLQPLQEEDVKWLTSLWFDFRRRLMLLLGSTLRHVSCPFALSALSNTKHKFGKKGDAVMVRSYITEADVSRLSSFTLQQCEAALVTDLLPRLARLHFSAALRHCKLPTLQAAVLCGLGLQHKTEDTIAHELDLQKCAVLDNKKKAINKLLEGLRAMLEDAQGDEIDDIDSAVAEEPNDTAVTRTLLDTVAEWQSRRLECTGNMFDNGKRSAKDIDEEDVLQKGRDKKRKKLVLSELRKEKRLL